MYKIILGSKSPRRRELLSQIGLEFDIITSEMEEIVTSTEPEQVVCDLSMQKAKDILRIISEKSNGNIESLCGSEYEGLIIIGADTVVALNNEIMGKPRDEEDAFNMLRKLSGNKHTVSTGVALIVIKDGEEKEYNFAETTEVYMYDISDEEIRKYIESLEPMDKAGSYGIQGLGAKFISKIHGDYNNVVGLPIGRIYQTIKQWL